MRFGRQITSHDVKGFTSSELSVVPVPYVPMHWWHDHLAIWESWNFLSRDSDHKEWRRKHDCEPFTHYCTERQEVHLADALNVEAVGSRRSTSTLTATEGTLVEEARSTLRVFALKQGLPPCNTSYRDRVREKRTSVRLDASGYNRHTEVGPRLQ